MAELPLPYAPLWRRLSEAPLVPALGLVLGSVVRDPDLGVGGRTLSHSTDSKAQIPPPQTQSPTLSTALCTPPEGMTQLGQPKGSGQWLWCPPGWVD